MTAKPDEPVVKSTPYYLKLQNDLYTETITLVFLIPWELVACICDSIGGAVEHSREYREEEGLSKGFLMFQNKLGW